MCSTQRSHSTNQRDTVDTPYRPRSPTIHEPRGSTGQLFFIFSSHVWSQTTSLTRPHSTFQRSTSPSCPCWTTRNCTLTKHLAQRYLYHRRMRSLRTRRAARAFAIPFQPTPMQFDCTYQPSSRLLPITGTTYRHFEAPLSSPTSASQPDPRCLRPFYGTTIGSQILVFLAGLG